MASGQIWDEFLQQLRVEAKKTRLVETAVKMEEGDIEGVPLDDI